MFGRRSRSESDLVPLKRTSGRTAAALSIRGYDIETRQNCRRLRVHAGTIGLAFYAAAKQREAAVSCARGGQHAFWTKHRANSPRASYENYLLLCLRGEYTTRRRLAGERSTMLLRFLIRERI